MGMDVDQARDDELAARIDGVGGVSRDVGLDGGDAASRDRHVADRVEPDGRIDDAPAPDDQVIPRPAAPRMFAARARTSPRSRPLLKETGAGSTWRGLPSPSRALA